MLWMKPNDLFCCQFCKLVTPTPFRSTSKSLPPPFRSATTALWVCVCCYNTKWALLATHYMIIKHFTSNASSVNHDWWRSDTLHSYILMSVEYRSVFIPSYWRCLWCSFYKYWLYRNYWCIMLLHIFQTTRNKNYIGIISTCWVSQQNICNYSHWFHHQFFFFFHLIFVFIILFTLAMFIHFLLVGTKFVNCVTNLRN